MFKAIAVLILILIITVFVVVNTAPATVTIPFLGSYDISLALIIVLSVVIGALIAFTPSFISIIGLKHKNRVSSKITEEEYKEKEKQLNKSLELAISENNTLLQKNTDLEKEIGALKSAQGSIKDTAT